MLYRIFFSNGNDRDELGRVSAPDIECAALYALEQYFENDLEYTTEYQSENQLFLMLDSCKYCDFLETTAEQKEEICENCEISEYIEIQKDENAEPAYKTIFGKNEYANIETGEKPKAYNETLVKAWNKGGNIGATELMYQTIKDNPQIAQGVDKEYIERINENHEKLLEEDEE